MFTYKSALGAFFFSFFIYAEYFGYEIFILNTLFALIGLYLLFHLQRKELFLTGFLIGIFWFWWIAYSFVYYELVFLIPIVLLAIGALYGAIFLLIGISTNIFYKAAIIFALSFLNPFGFNWFKIELIFINSYFGTSKIEFFLILFIMALFIQYHTNFFKKAVIAGAFFVCSAFIAYNFFNTKTVPMPKLAIAEHNTSIAQETKWDRNMQPVIIEENFLAIKEAVSQQKDLIILPETAFPLVLNTTKYVEQKLFDLSFDIAIITGALYVKEGLLYNSTYFYSNGKREVAHKVVLVPFGEAVPLPEKMRNWINDIFYDGAKDYETALYPTTFTIQNEKFRNAICYEATSDAVYQNLDTPYVIAISNNAWFTPSIQPTLQKLLMKYYEHKYTIRFISVTNL